MPQLEVEWKQLQRLQRSRSITALNYLADTPIVKKKPLQPTVSCESSSATKSGEESLPAVSDDDHVTVNDQQALATPRRDECDHQMDTGEKRTSFRYSLQRSCSLDYLNDDNELAIKRAQALEGPKVENSSVIHYYLLTHCNINRI